MKVDLSKLDKGLGFVIRGEEQKGYFGNIISRLGDFNGDGVDDFAVFSANANARNTSDDEFGSGGMKVFLGGNIASREIYSSVNADISSDNADISIVLSNQLSRKTHILQDRMLNGMVSLASNLGLAEDNRPDSTIDAQKKSIASLDIKAEEILNADNYSKKLRKAITTDVFKVPKTPVDINGDGMNDIVISSPHAANGDSETYVIFGVKNPQQEIRVDMLNGENGFVIKCNNRNLGYFTNAGNFNDDSYGDIRMTEVNLLESMKDLMPPVYRFFYGHGGDFNSEYNCDNLPKRDMLGNGNTGHHIFDGVEATAYTDRVKIFDYINHVDKCTIHFAPQVFLGTQIFSMNEEIIISSPVGPHFEWGTFNSDKKYTPVYKNNGEHIGIVYKISGCYGGEKIYSATSEKVSKIFSEMKFSLFGYIADKIDFNGDGLDDLVVTEGFLDHSPGSSKGYLPGAAYIFFSQRNEMHASDRATSDADIKIVIDDMQNNAIMAIANIGDVNDDGFSDLAIGAFNSGLHGEGAVYVLFGGDSLLQQIHEGEL